MPKRVEEVRLRMERFLLCGIEFASIRGESLACWEKSCWERSCWEKSREGVVGEEGEELVEVGVRS